MSILGDRLKQYIDESGYTVYKLSKLSGVNRTSIVRMLNSNRIPERDNMEKLLPYLKLTPAEKDEVWKLYETMTCGEDIFYRREYVLNLILSLFNEHASPNGANPKPDTVPVDADPHTLAGGYYCRSSSETIHLIYLLLHSEPPVSEIDIFAPFSGSFTSDLLNLISMTAMPGIKIRHLVHFVKNPDKSGEINYNLNVLSNLLPFACSEDIDYTSRYLYINTPVTSDSMVPFPFYLIIGGCIVLLSADFMVSYFSSAKNMHAYYLDLFNRTDAISELLVNNDTSFEAFASR